MMYSCPKDFKNGKYFFNKYGVMDLLILVPGVIVGLIIDCLNFVLFMPMTMFHNLFQRVIVEIDYHLRQKSYPWCGINYNNYEEKDDAEN